jgi:hypothetical protein
MNSRHLVRCLAVGAVLTAAWLAAGAAIAAPEKEAIPAAGPIVSIDLDECEPFEVRTVIMEIHREKGSLVVAEREIRALDTTVGGKTMKTEFLGQDGRPEAVGAFRVGQYVHVEGFLHPDGYVAALMVQKIAKPKDAKLVYRPVAESAKKGRPSKLRPRMVSGGN